MKSLITLILIISVSMGIGCTMKQAEPITIYKNKIIVPEPPQEMMICSDAPAVPQGNFTDVQAAEYIVRLYVSYRDCKATLNELRQWFEETHEELTDPNAMTSNQ